MFELFFINNFMKICVYAIAKNESKFIRRWYESVKEADYICVLDTGSTDGSQEIFKSLGVIFQEKHYENFRFDVARNDSMKLIPDDTDICVCVDLDEIFNPGWSTILKQFWTPNTGRARYRYTWNFNPDGSEGTIFFLDKIHKHKVFTWTHPVHEVLTQINNKKYETITLENIQLNHHADPKKSRSNYLPLLELSVKENPTNDRNMHYLGREYMFHKNFDKAILTLKKHLSLPTATWNEERCASMRYIANCYKQKNNLKMQEKFLLKSLIEYNQSREPYFELGVLYYETKKYLSAIFVFNEMLKITNRQFNYMSSSICWGSLPYEYLAMCYYYTRNYHKAIEATYKAIKLNSKDSTLKNKLKIFIDLYNNKNKK